jgi:chemotaxis protein CheZ
MDAATANSEVVNDERLQLALSLVTALEDGNEDEAEKSITELARTYEASLFNEIGQLTRQVHDALSYCGDDERIADIAKHEIPDARERLRYVIEKTEDSANRTLDIAEKLLNDSGVLADEAGKMKTEWQRFSRREMSVEEFRALSHRLEDFLQKIGCDAEKFRSDISDLMVAQDFQDLTGQVIKKVIDLVQEVENKLVSVIRSAGHENTSTVNPVKDIEAEGPQVNAANKANVVNNQDDVDDLLSSLGF